jgi:glycerol-3-phosphate dehydrogenase (NAD(P)+)
MRIVVIGAGAWGTAMASSAASTSDRHQVTLWARNAAQVSALQAARANDRYLPGVLLPAGLEVMGGSPQQVRDLGASADLVVIGTPMAALRDWLTLLSDLAVPVAWLCKGFEQPVDGSAGRLGCMGHEIQRLVAPRLLAGVLSGPSFALEVARNQPTALVAASGHAPVRQALIHAFHSSTLRVYANDDVVGVEVGGAVKNVLAIATGLCDGLGLGLNARAALITRGLAEMARLGEALGAQSETFMGLSGLGDLVLTATGDLSRNRRVGQLLATGQSADQAVHSLGHVSEGVYSARTVVARAKHLGIEMPISEAVVDLLDGALTPQRALARLMGRDPAAEHL